MYSTRFNGCLENKDDHNQMDTALVGPSTNQQVVRSRGHRCGDIELTGYLTNTSGPVSFSDPSMNGHLHYPNDVDRSLNETTVHKIKKYSSEYNNNPPNDISFIPDITSTSGRLHSEFV
jgi:hypothetical protein